MHIVNTYIHYTLVVNRSICRFVKLHTISEIWDNDTSRHRSSIIYESNDNRTCKGNESVVNRRSIGRHCAARSEWRRVFLVSMCPLIVDETESKGAMSQLINAERCRRRRPRSHIGISKIIYSTQYLSMDTNNTQGLNKVLTQRHLKLVIDSKKIHCHRCNRWCTHRGNND